MNTTDIKNLARMTSEQKNIDKNVMNFVLNKLSRRELILYIRHLKMLVDKNTVRILSTSPLDTKIKKNIVGKFSSKNVIFETTEIGDGIKAIVNDTIQDLSLPGFLDKTVEELKSN
jgi:hypothetical protein